ncbi:MAG: peptide deformylase [Candidatus Acetothermia bacterium]|jgi:peptide deformylase|nr:peptide deformylase [Candidatus Acetothermia bacterium]
MVRVYPDPILRRPAQPVQPGSDEARMAATSLRRAFAELEALGLAANQIGFPVRVIMVRLGDEDQVLLNPAIVARSSALSVESEGCLSIPGVEAEVPRAAEVVVHAMDEEGRPVELTLTDLEARLLQHEVDHLDGVLYVDHLPFSERRRILRAFREAQKRKEQVTSAT